MILAADGAHQSFCAQTALDGDGELWAHAAHRDQALKDALLDRFEKAIKCQSIFANVGVDEEGHLRSLRWQRAKRGHADHNVIADAAGLDNRLLWMFRQELTAQVRNHSLIVLVAASFLVGTGFKARVKTRC